MEVVYTTLSPLISSNAKDDLHPDIYTYKTSSSLTASNATDDFHPDNCTYGDHGYVECHIGRAIHTYLLPLILFVGFFGNTFSFAVMLNSMNRKMTCCLCFAALAVSDTIALLAIAIHRVAESYRGSNDGLCSLYAFMLNTASACSSFIIALITYQRFGAVCKVLSRQLKLTKKKASWIILLITIVCAVFQLPITFTSKLKSSTECAGYASHSKGMTSVWVWMNTILFFFLPVALVTYWNARIYFELRSHRNLMVNSNSHSYPLTKTTSSPDLNIQVNASPTANPSHHYDADRKLTRMMIFISLGFICLSLPMHVRYIHFLLVEPSNSTGHAMRFLVYHITNKLFIANHAINFYLYCLSGARFRNDFVHLVKMPFRYIKYKCTE